MGRFEVFKGIDGLFYFRLKAENGEKIAHSEGYTSKQSAINGIAAVRRCGANAPAYDLT